MFVLIIFAVILIGLIKWFVNGSYEFWKKRNVPYPKPRLFFGNVRLSKIFTTHPKNIYLDIYYSFPDCSYVGYYRMMTPEILLRDTELIKDIVIKEFASFHDNDLKVDENSDPLFAKNPFLIKGKKWKIVRSQLTGALTSGKIKNMFVLINGVCKDLVKYVNRTSEYESLDAKEVSAKFTSDVVAACAFGLEANSFTDPNSKFYKLGESFFMVEGFAAWKSLFVFMFPAFVKILRYGVISKEITVNFINIIQETVKYREENNIVRNDYLDLLISLKNKPGEYVFTDMDLMAQAMTFYGDGMETSSNVLSFALYELAKNPAVQEKLRIEFDSILDKNDQEITYEIIQKMQYLDMVISEVLRKYPAALFLMKTCTEKFTLPPAKENSDAVVIEPGMTLVIPVYAIHHDPKFYPEPESFDPERFSEEAKKERPKCAYMPFGEGPRMCLGSRFALAQIKAAVATLVMNFQIELCSKNKLDLEVSAIGFIVPKKGNIWIQFKKLSVL